MGSRLPRLPEDIEDILVCYWSTDVRGDVPSLTARQHMEQLRNRDAVRRFLIDVIRRGVVSPREWAGLCEVNVTTQSEVREDARRFWDWLFEGEPLPEAPNSRPSMQPPQS